ncbi:hypothetical protein LINGRAHAP2_LOCUS10095 [Linum grandiflorum]
MPHVPCSFAIPVSKPFPISVQDTRIQGDSHRAFAPYLEKHVSVGSIYAITGFTLQPPPPSYRACCFRHWLALGPATKYELLPHDVSAAFKPESYEFVPFAQFLGRLPPCPYLTGSRLSFGVPFTLHAFQILCHCRFSLSYRACCFRIVIYG